MDAKYFGEIKTREQAATPGPWVVDAKEQTVRAINTDEQLIVVDYSTCRWADDNNPNNADFISHARTDISALIADNIAKDQQIAMLKKEVRSAVEAANMWTDAYGKECEKNATLNKALELACGNDVANYDGINAEWLKNHYIQQVQEQEKQNGKAD